MYTRNVSYSLGQIDRNCHVGRVDVREIHIFGGRRKKKRWKNLKTSIKTLYALLWNNIPINVAYSYMQCTWTCIRVYICVQYTCKNVSYPSTYIHYTVYVHSMYVSQPSPTPIVSYYDNKTCNKYCTFIRTLAKCIPFPYARIPEHVINREFIHLFFKWDKNAAGLWRFSCVFFFFRCNLRVIRILYGGYYTLRDDIVGPVVMNLSV